MDDLYEHVDDRCMHEPRFGINSGSSGPDSGFGSGCVMNETLFDWSNLEIDLDDDAERQQCIDEDAMYVLLGLRDEDERTRMNSQGAASFTSQLPSQGVMSDDIGVDVNDIDAAMPVDDEIPEAVNILHDANHPSMARGTVYPSMADFRLAVRQYAINEEFEFGTTKSDKLRYRVYCQGNEGTCPWRVNGYTRPDGSVMVLILFVIFVIYTVFVFLWFDVASHFLFCRLHYWLINICVPQAAG